MKNKIFIIHSSEIICQGLNSIIKNHFDINAIVLSSIEDLKNYYEIDSARMIIFVDTKLNLNNLSHSVKVLQKSSLVKIINIVSSENNTESDIKTDSCISLNSPITSIYDLIDRCLFPKGYVSQNKKSTLLTDRETDVLKLVAFGKTNKEIASELFISIHTVISHRKNITEKLGIKSISGLTVYAILNKLIDTTIIDPESLI